WLRWPAVARTGISDPERPAPDGICQRDRYRYAGKRVDERSCHDLPPLKFRVKFATYCGSLTLVAAQLASTAMRRDGGHDVHSDRSHAKSNDLEIPAGPPGSGKRHA